MYKLRMNNMSGSPDKKIMYSMRQMAMFKRMSFLEKLIRKNMIVLTDGKWKPEWADKMVEKLTDIFDNFQIAYGDNWDIHIEQTPLLNPDYSEEARLEAEEEGEEYEVTEYLYNSAGNLINKWVIIPFVYYENIVITNENNKFQELEDLIILLPMHVNDDFDDFELYFSKPEGTRLKFTYDQFIYGYVHSHLHQKILRNNFSNHVRTGEFCIGTSEIGDILMELNANGFDKDLHGLLLTMVDTLAKWESIEGVPYVSMKKIVSDTNVKINHSVEDLNVYYTSMLSHYKAIPEEREHFKLNYVFNQNRYRVKIDSALENTLLHYINKHLSVKKNLLVKEVNGEFFGYNRTEIVPRQRLYDEITEDGERPYTFINGRKVELKISGFQGEAIDETDYYIYPKFKEYVAEQLESELYQKAITISAIEREGRTVNA